jgi:hypothetical protein
MDWIKRPDYSWVLTHGGLVATLTLSDDTQPVDDRYDLKVIDLDEGGAEVKFATNRTLAEGKDYAEEFIGDYLDDGSGAPDDFDGWEEPF